MRKHVRVRNGKARPVFCLTALSAALLSIMGGGASANEYSYANDPGYVAADPSQVAAAKASWETAEYLRSGGLAVLNASSAYALGYFGQNRTVGVMDSGSLATHRDFQGDRWTFVVQKGTYGTSGMRYRGSGYFTNLASGPRPLGEPYTAGDPFDLTGAYDPAINDSHGTSVTGLVGGNRDGDPTALNMHGLAFGTNMVIGNTGATDSNNYGPYQDYNFFYAGWKAMAEAGAEVINNSWGTNIRINLAKNTDPASNSYYPFDNSGGPGQDGVLDNSVKGLDGGNVGNMIPTNNVPQAEYEYFYWKKVYGDGNKSFVDAAYDVSKEYGTVFVMTTGNRDNGSPFHRALYPYFHPDAEQYWIAAAGIMKEDGDLSTSGLQWNGRYVLVNAINSETGVGTGTTGSYNEAGLAKWWTMTGYTLGDAYTTNLSGTWGTGSFSGTSCAAPHLAGAMGVLMSRYMNMPATQVRDVMFTTGTNKNPDGSTFDGWTSPDGVPDERYGWGMPDLEKGMYGPGQFLGKLEYNASVTPLDVWTNDISQVALEARKAEDTAWLNFYKQNGINGLGLYNDGMDARGGAYAPLADYELGTSFVVADNDDDPTNHIVSQADAEKWRKEYADARAAAIQEKLDKGLYDGSLVKLGAGTLIMTGDNTYKGGTTVKAGELYGFTESFGSEKVLVSGGKFGLLSSYNDLFTMQGQLASTASHKADVEVDKGGTFVVVAGQNAQAGALVFKDGSQVTVGAIDKDLAQDVYDNDTTATGTVTATTLTGFDKAVVAPNYAFLDLDVTLTANTLTGSLTKNATATYAGYGADSNGRTIGRVIDQNRAGGLYEALPIPTVTKEQVRRTLDSLGSDLYLNADSAGVVNSVSMARTVKNQAQGIGSGRTAKLGDTARLWATATANWGSVDFGHADADSTFHAGLVGAEVDVTANSTVGVFFGAGSSELKGGGRYGKVNSDDLHGGLYGIYRCDALTVNYGLMHTRQERDAKRTLVVGDLAGYNKVSPNASITQVFAEAAYTKLSTASYSLEPYAGLSVMKVKSDGFSERVGNMTFRTGSSSQSIQAANVGVRGSIPVTGGTVIKGDISAMHFFGDSRPEARMILADTGAAKIKGGKLGSMMGVGLGVETSLSKTSKLDVSYVGVYNGDIKSNGIYANLRIGF